VSDVKRHKAVGSGIVKADPKGDLVLYVDYARLKAEVERLTAFTTRTIIPNEELQAQVERLTKAEDKMIEVTYVKGVAGVDKKGGQP